MTPRVQNNQDQVVELAANTWSDYLKPPAVDANIGADFWKVVECSGTITIEFNGDPSDTIVRGAGAAGRHEPFTKIRVKSTLAQTIRLALGQGDEYANPGDATGGGALTTTQAGQHQPANPSIAAGGSTNLAASTYATTLGLLINVEPAAPGPVQINLSGASRSVYIYPSHQPVFLPYDGSQTIQVVNDNGVAVSIGYDWIGK